MDVALGEIYTGVFSVRFRLFEISLQRTHLVTLQSSDTLWDELHAAGEVEHDRFWRMPIDEDYGPQIYSSNADLQNVNLTFVLSLLRPIDFSFEFQTDRW
jgi:aminopeptidase